jgi:hypothetical protein
MRLFKRYIPAAFSLILLLSFNLPEETIETEEIKPSYSVDIHVWHRKNPETSKTWKNVTNNAQLHYIKHSFVPMFRMYKASLHPKDTVYEYLLDEKVLKSYCRKKLIQTNSQHRGTAANDFIWAGQKGLLKCVDREELFIKIYYRKRNDTLSKYEVDSMRYEIMLDQEYIEGSDVD